MQLKTLLQKLFCCISINTSLFGMKNEEQNEEVFYKKKQKKELYKQFMEADHAKRVAMIWKHNMLTKNQENYKNSEFYYNKEPVTVYFEIFTSLLNIELLREWTNISGKNYNKPDFVPSKIIKNYNSLLQQDNEDLSRILLLSKQQIESAKTFAKNIIDFTTTEKELEKIQHIYDNIATPVIKKSLETTLYQIQDILQEKKNFVENTSIESKEIIFDSMKNIYNLEGKKFELSGKQEKEINEYIDFMQKTNKDLDNLKKKEEEMMNLISDFREQNNIYVEYVNVYKIHINDLKDKEGKVVIINDDDLEDLDNIVKNCKLPRNCVLVNDEKILVLVVEYRNLIPKNFLQENNCKVPFELLTDTKEDNIYNVKYDTPYKARYNENEVSVDGFFYNRYVDEKSQQSEIAIYFRITPMLEIGSATVPLRYLQEEQKSTILVPQDDILFFPKEK